MTAAALLDRPLVEQVAALQGGDCAVAELTAAALDRAAAAQMRLNAFIMIDREGALARAAALDRLPPEERRRLPLFGAPVAHKDMFARKGRVVTFGSRLFADNVADRTATVVARLDAAGAVDIGTLNMSEFACNPYGLNVLVGRARNPWNPDHVAGGSSSGSAAAVAARLVAGSFGSDTGGSVRLPAAACGVFGLLPTNNRISRYGMLPLSHSLDNAGPLARSVRDIARLLRATAGADPDEPTASQTPVEDYEAGLGTGVRGLRLALPGAYYREESDADVNRMLDETERVFRGLGATLVEAELPDPRPLDCLGNIMILAEAASYHAENLKTRGDLYTPLVKTRIEFGFGFDAASYIDALRLRPVQLARFLDVAFAGADAVILPMLPHSAPLFADVEAALAGRSDLSFSLAKFTRSINYLGLPGISVPHGRDTKGLPLAFQVIGRPFDEATILRVAHAFAEAVPPSFPG